MPLNDLGPSSKGVGQSSSSPLQSMAAWTFSEMGDAMAPAVLEQEKTEKLTEEQKKAVLDDYAAAMRGEVVDARKALEEIRVAHGF